MGTFLSRFRFATSTVLSALIIVSAFVFPGAAVFTSAAWAVPADQSLPAIAFDGTNYLIAWQDGRTGTYPDIYCARVNRAGVVIEPDGIAVSTAANQQSSAAVAFDGTNYLIVWQDMRNGMYFQIYAARVTPSCVVLDPDGIAVCQTTTNELAPAVAFDGTNYLVVWQDLRNTTSDIYAARVSKAGVVLDPGGIAVSTAVNPQAYPSVAFGGTDYMVVWHDERNSSHYDLYGARVSKNGEVLNPSGIPISVLSKRQGFPSIAYDGTNYVVVWQDDRSGFYDIYGCRVNSLGSVLDPSGIPISTATSDQSFPAVAYDGANYMVVWQDYRAGFYYDIYGSRLTKAGVVLNPSGIAISTAAASQLAPVIAFDGFNYLTVWQDGRNGTNDIIGSRITTSGLVLDPSGVVDVVFESASALVNNGCVSLAWRVAVDVPSSNFVISRSGSPGGEYLDVAADARKESEGSFSLMDCGVQPGRTYYYRIDLLSSYGDVSYGPVEATVPATLAFSLQQSYPNPFNPSCAIRYEIPRSCRTSLRVFDVGGTLVKTFADSWREKGAYVETWDGRSDDGRNLPSGVYLFVIKAGDFSAAKKAVLLR